MGRIPDTLARCARDGVPCISLELFPPQTELGVAALLRRVEAAHRTLRPHFVSLTWRANMKDEDVWLRVGAAIQAMGVDVLMHLTCHLPKEAILRILRRCRDAGLTNVLALRGDTPGSDRWRAPAGGLASSSDLVRLIRETHGDAFAVAVAGYPEVHLESWNSSSLPPSEQARAADVARLRDKVSLGADFVLSQFVLDPGVFASFVRLCRDAGITVPILPSILPVTTFESWSKFVLWCRTRVPGTVRASGAWERSEARTC